MDREEGEIIWHEETTDEHDSGGGWVCGADTWLHMESFPREVQL